MSRSRCSSSCRAAPPASEAGTGGPGFWAGYWRHRPAYDRADIDTARYWTRVLGRAPGAVRLRRI
ncbi:MAG TPA: hypothetical protein VHZ03_26125, partial [Trebonia sp.]|nr:hypothetical protein [Trebonia sp.]